jgi:branched-chain amino acid transport system permease protein
MPRDGPGAPSLRSKGIGTAHVMTVAAGLMKSRLAPSGPTIALLVVVALIALAIATGGPVIVRQVVSGLLLGAIYMTVALAFTLTIGVLNFLNFTIPTLFMLTGMVAWALQSGGYVGFADGWAWLIALMIGVAAAVAASMLVERFTFRYLKMKHGDATEHAIPLVSSLGFLLIFENLILIQLGSDSQRFALPFKADLHIFGLVIGVAQLASCALAVAVVGTLSFILKRTSMGRALRTIAENPDTASLLGVNVGRVVPVVFILTGLLSGVAGALFTINYGNVSPFMGDNVGTKAIAAMILGGIGSIWGAVIGGLLVGLAETMSIQYFGGDSATMTVWGLVLAIIVLRPKGLFGIASIGKGKM